MRAQFRCQDVRANVFEQPPLGDDVTHIRNIVQRDRFGGENRRGHTRQRRVLGATNRHATLNRISAANTKFVHEGRLKEINGFGQRRPWLPLIAHDREVKFGPGFFSLLFRLIRRDWPRFVRPPMHNPRAAIYSEFLPYRDPAPAVDWPLDSLKYGPSKPRRVHQAKHSNTREGRRAFDSPVWSRCRPPAPRCARCEPAGHPAERVTRDREKLTRHPAQLSLPAIVPRV